MFTGSAAMSLTGAGGGEKGRTVLAICSGGELDGDAHVVEEQLAQRRNVRVRLEQRVASRYHVRILPRQ